MVIGDLKKQLKKKLSPRDTELLIMGILNINYTDYVLGDNTEIDEKAAYKVIEASNKAALGEPIQYILGDTEFMSLPFYTKTNVLIPRPDTETLVEAAINEIKDKKLSVLEIGTGTGCIAVSIAHYCKRSSVTAIDISDDAIETANKNAKLNNVKIRIKKLDILNESLSDRFDIIVSNPPYIPTGDIKTLDKTVRDFEPHIALDGGNDGLMFYKRIITIAPDILKCNGKIMFEVGYNQSDEVKNLLKHNFKKIKAIKDMCEIERVVTGCLI